MSRGTGDCGPMKRGLNTVLRHLKELKRVPVARGAGEIGLDRFAGAKKKELMRLLR